MSSGPVPPPQYDLFISHAREDKAEFVEPLVDALEDRGLRVWYDTREIGLGDDFRQKMDEGLRSSRFGVVVISPSFRKYWPEAELSALFNQERVFDAKRILPVVHALTQQEVANTWPLLAARAAAYSSEGPAGIAEKIAAAILQEVSPPTRGLTRFYGVPRTRSVQFVGRMEELTQLRDLLNRSGSVRVAASVEGLAGIGKTELALQLVHRLAAEGDSPGGIFWFDAENPDLTPIWGSAIADGLGLAPRPVAERAALAVRTLSRRDVATLLVLDNVEQWTQARQPGPLPEGTHLRYLVTTRRRRLGGARFEHVDLGFLEPKYARRLLGLAAGRDLETATGHEELLEYLGGHALAVELAGAYLAEFPEETPASYLEALLAGHEVGAEVSELVRYERTVSQAFEAIWGRLDEETRGAWRLAACFETEFASPQIADAVGLTAKLRRSLRRFHLLESDAEARWRMHRLTREYGRRAGTEEELAAAREAFVAGCVEFCGEKDAVEGLRFYLLRLYLRDRSHLDAALGQAAEVLGEKDSRVTDFQDRIASALRSAGDLPGARRLGELALAAGIENLGEDHPEVAILRSNLARVLQMQGHLEEARKLLELALESDLKNLGEDHPEVAIRRSNLGLVLEDQGDLEGARELLEMALAAGIENLGEDHPEVAIRRSNLGTVLEAQGDLPGARKLHEEALESSIKNFGEDHLEIAGYRGTLAKVLRQQGDLEGARELLELALAAEFANLGEDHPSVATRRSNLATVLEAQGDFEGAREMFDKALKSNLKNFGEDHPEVAIVRSNLGEILKVQGDLEGARELLELALESNLKNLGEDHSNVAIMRFNLANICEAEGDLKAACDLLERSLQGHEKIYGETHPATALIRVSLADVLRQLGSTQRARAEARTAKEGVVGQPKGSYFRERVERVAERILGDS